MHEVSVLYDAITMAEDVAKENNADKIKYITLEVGELTGFVPQFFTEYFPIITDERPITKGAQLNIINIPGEALCNDCRSLYNVMRNEGMCPNCKSRDKKIISGLDFVIKEIGV